MADKERSFPFDSVENEQGQPDRAYFAEDFSNYFAQFVGNGVYPNPSTNLAVQSLNSNMVVTVAIGSAFINGYGYINTEPYTVAVTQAHVSYNRRDIIVVQLSVVGREIKLLYKQGTASANPVKPALTRNADIYELQLAEIFVGSGVQSITQANITDTRLDTTLCGIVSAVVDSVDTSVLFSQYETYLNTKIAEWNATQAQQTQDFNTQMESQQAAFDTKQGEIDEWYNDKKLDISNLQKFDFDNLIYFKGHKYSASKTTNPTVWTETITKTSTQEVFATRVSTKGTEGSWTVVTTCVSLGISTSIVYSKVAGAWEGVIS